MSFEHRRIAEWKTTLCIIHNTLLTVDGRDDRFQEDAVNEPEDDKDTEVEEKGLWVENASQADRALRDKLKNTWTRCKKVMMFAI